MSYEALGALAILLGFVLFVAGLALWLWAVVDAVRRPEAQWAAAGQSKALWLVVLVVSLLVGGLAWIGALLYLLVARPALTRAERARAGRYGHGPAGPVQGWPGPR